MADSEVEYGVSAVPDGSDIVVITGKPGSTTSVNVLSANALAALAMTGPPALNSALTPRASVTRTVNVKAPICVGVPESRHVGLSVMPCGRAPDVMTHVYGATPPEIGIWYEYGWLNVAS